MTQFAPSFVLRLGVVLSGVARLDGIDDTICCHGEGDYLARFTTNPPNPLSRHSFTHEKAKRWGKHIFANPLTRLSLAPRHMRKQGGDMVVVSQTNVTQLKQLEQEMLQVQQQAWTQREKERQTMFAGVTHELRTPLNGIIGLSSALIEEVHSFSPSLPLPPSPPQPLFPSLILQS